MFEITIDDLKRLGDFIDMDTTTIARRLTKILKRDIGAHRVQSFFDRHWKELFAANIVVTWRYRAPGICHPDSDLAEQFRGQLGVRNYPLHTRQKLYTFATNPTPTQFFIAWIATGLRQIPKRKKTK